MTMAATIQAYQKISFSAGKAGAIWKKDFKVKKHWFDDKFTYPFFNAACLRGFHRHIGHQEFPTWADAALFDIPDSIFRYEGDAGLFGSI